MFKKLLCIMISMCSLLISPIEVTAEETIQTTYDFNYSENEYFPQILQINIDKMKDIQKNTATSYSSEFVVDYVTPSRDYLEVENTLNEITQISNTICDGISNDYEKLQKIHDYVCQTTSYDHVSAENSANFDTICLKNVLQNKRTICAGYSNFFSALCGVQGLYCINIRGSVITADYPNIIDDSSPTNHEWNAVWFDQENRWVFIDCTWDSNNDYFKDGFYYDDSTRKYFDMSMEFMSTNHKIKIIDHRDFLDAINYFSIDTSTFINDNNSIDTQNTQNQDNKTAITIVMVSLMSVGMILTVIIRLKK